jgi:hypothetical protein
MQDRTYPLDTSALQAIPGRTLVQCREAGIDARVSPVSFWELLCHLDEGDYARKRGNLRKCHLVPILDEPFAAHGHAVGAGETVNRSRIEEPVVIQQLLNHLNSCSTLDEFYASEVTYDDGRVGLVSGCSARARDRLRADEDRFVQILHGLEAEVLSFFPAASGGVLSDADFVWMIRALAEGLAGRYRDEDGISSAELSTRVFDSIFAHSGLMLARVLDRLRRGAAAMYDRNDTEDAYIAFHLDLTRPWTLVTADQGVLSGVNRAHDALRAAEGVEGESRVMSVEQFIREIVPQ